MVAVKVTLLVPLVTGIPLITLPLLVSPAGSVEIVKVGVGKPFAEIVYENGCPDTPVAVNELVIDGVTEISITSTLVSVPPAFTALILTFVVPPAVGVPLMFPAGVTVTPGGNGVASNTIGTLPDAVMSYENAAPTTALAVSELVMTGAS